MEWSGGGVQNVPKDEAVVFQGTGGAVGKGSGVVRDKGVCNLKQTET